MNETVIEAVLFSAGKPLSIEEISQNSGISVEDAKSGLKKLISGYQKRDTAIEIARVGSKFAMQLKPDIMPKAGKLAPTTIPKPVLKTAALIAYHQPVKQSKLMMMVGDKVYDHVRFLTDTGLVSARKYSHTFILTTSKKFPEYFGIPTSKRDDIKRWIAEKVGIKLTAKQIKQMAKEATEPDDDTGTEEAAGSSAESDIAATAPAGAGQIDESGAGKK